VPETYVVELRLTRRERQHVDDLAFLSGMTIEELLRDALCLSLLRLEESPRRPKLRLVPTDDPTGASGEARVPPIEG
jgi:hypothetical protein